EHGGDPRHDDALAEEREHRGDDVREAPRPGVEAGVVSDPERAVLEERARREDMVQLVDLDRVIELDQAHGQGEGREERDVPGENAADRTSTTVGSRNGAGGAVVLAHRGPDGRSHSSGLPLTMPLAARPDVRVPTPGPATAALSSIV